MGGLGETSYWAGSLRQVGGWVGRAGSPRASEVGTREQKKSAAVVSGLA